MRTHRPCSKSVGSFGHGYVSGAAQRALPCRFVAAEQRVLCDPTCGFLCFLNCCKSRPTRPTCGRIALAPKVSVPLAAVTCPGLPNVRFPVVRWLLNMRPSAAHRPRCLAVGSATANRQVAGRHAKQLFLLKGLIKLCSKSSPEGGPVAGRPAPIKMRAGRPRREIAFSF